MSCSESNPGPVYYIKDLNNEEYPYIDLGPDKADDDGNIVVIGDDSIIKQRQGTNNYCFRVRGPGPMCIKGLTIDNVTEMNQTWSSRYGSDNSASLLFRSGKVTIEGACVRNAWDFFRPENREQDVLEFEIIGSRSTGAADDGIENDWIHRGTVRDCLFDGTYIFNSAKGASTGKGDEEIHVEDTIIRMMRRPGPNGHGMDVQACGEFLKYDTKKKSPPVRWKNVIIYWEWCSATKYGESSWIEHAPKQMGFWESSGKFLGAENVTVIWPDEARERFGEWNDLVGTPPPGVTVTNDVSIFEEARKEWIRNHPDVMRFSNDPMTIELNSEGRLEVRSIDLGEPTEPVPCPPFTASVTDIDSDRAVFEFTNGQETTGETWLGPDAENLERVKEETGYYSSHRQSVSGLTPATQYSYQCGGCNRSGECNVSEIGSFRTLNEDGTPVEPPTEPPAPPPTDTPTGALSWVLTDEDGKEFTMFLKLKNGGNGET